MNRFKLLLYLSIGVLIVAGILFVRATRYDKAVSSIETIKDKVIVLYSSNYKRMYSGSNGSNANDMSMLCMEGVSLLKEGKLNSVFVRMQEGTEDPYTSSGIQLKRTLSKGYKYALLDISRGQTKHGNKYTIGEKKGSSISIILSKKSKGYEDSLLLAGRIKGIVDKKYPALPIKIVTADDNDYNQNIGSMGMLVEFGDAANDYDDAKESLKVFCKALLDVVDIEK